MGSTIFHSHASIIFNITNILDSTNRGYMIYIYVDSIIDLISPN